MRYAAGIVLIGALVWVGVWYAKHHRVPTISEIPPTQVACTMEAKLCPDGSSVGRIGPACEFAPCPDMNTAPRKIDRREPGEPIEPM